jgi:ketosteroid isomerase-like protein
MPRFIRSLPVVVWCALLSAAPLAVADESSDRASLEAAAQAWMKAFNARDVDALAAGSTSDIVLLDGGGTSPVSGIAAARNTWAHVRHAGDGQLTSVTKEAVIVGDVAWRIGVVSLALPNFGEASNQSLEIWKRVNGRWKLHRQMSSNLLLPLNLPEPVQPVYDQPTN